ncbi:ornithine cyclodeaminase family protein [Pseudoclavibacter terrae]|uniref:ornithine cyclodeaminase family protein n=1 Tax=Pseudoclavibacter terrae TaxID=1530195 RepID=UPI00232F9B4A|nr:ornithine cyclodeaminase family protein [Pseudoclavibacter terrae]
MVIASLTDALRRGDDGDSVPRTSLPTRHGELLIMPAAGSEYFGVKLAAIGMSPEITARVQGGYLLFSQSTMAPLALIDGVELTLRRTAGMSALAASVTGTPSGHVHIFGAGPQAIAHAEALHATGLAVTVGFSSRDPEKAEAAAAAAAAAGVPIAARPLEDARIVVCATTSGTPLFSSADVASDAAIIAVGSHHPDRREVGTDVVRNAWTIVDGREAASREAGDVIMAEKERGAPVVRGTLGDVVRGEIDPPPDRRVFFKSVGEGWQDLAVAGASLRRDGGAAAPTTTKGDE